MAKILIIDDDTMFCEMLRSAMALYGHEVDTAYSLQQGQECLRSGCYEVLFLDVCLPDGNGMDVIPRLGSSAEAPALIMITAEGDPEGAERAIIQGAWDYIRKPATLESMAEAVTRALAHRERLLQCVKRPLDTEGLIGNSPSMRHVLTALSASADSETPVLITGETGTGKELFARAIHRNSRRASAPFIIVDCATLSPALIESELFGHQRGAFTGAVSNRTGLVRQAHGGTLFLDEVGELPLEQQRAFLRVLQEHRFRPVGSQEQVESDFRLVAATHRDLRAMARHGSFREDLLYRLQGAVLPLPPLRERVGDIALVAQHHADRLCERHGLEAKVFSPALQGMLEQYPWPGNVRELVNVVENLVFAAREESFIVPEHLSSMQRATLARARLSTPVESLPPQHPIITTESLLPWKQFRQQRMEQIEAEYLNRLLLQCNGHITRASRVAGVSRQRLYDLLNKHGMVREWRRSDDT